MTERKTFTLKSRLLEEKVILNPEEDIEKTYKENNCVS